ncbi:MAG: hypothetical protein ACRD2P_03085 [Terriglobia bacterium]
MANIHSMPGKNEKSHHILRERRFTVLPFLNRIALSHVVYKRPGLVI